MRGNTPGESLRETIRPFVESGEPRTTPEVAEELGVGRRTAYARLERLVEAGRLRTKKVGANARVWWRPPSGDGAGVGDTARADDGADTTTSGRGAVRDRQLRALVETAEEYAVLALDPGGTVRAWNAADGWDESDDAGTVVGGHFSRFHTPADRDEGVTERTLRAAAELGTVREEGRRLRPDGSRFRAAVTVSAVRTDGDVVGYTAVLRDLTDRRAAEADPAGGRGLDIGQFDSRRDLVYTFDADGELVRWNDRLAEVTGYTDAEIEGMRPDELVPEPARSEVRAVMERVTDRPESVTFELPLVTADGAEIPYEFTCGPLHDEDGELDGFTGIGRDARRRPGRSGRGRPGHELGAELDEVFDRISDGFYALDDELRFTFINDRATSLLGLDRFATVGRNVREAVDLAPELEAGLLEARERQAPVVVESYFEPAEEWFESNIYPSETGISVYFRAVTERRERETELRRKESRLRAITEHFPNGVVALVDEELRYTTFGGSLEGDTGLSRPVFEGEPLSDSLPDRIADVVIPGYETALDGESTEFVDSVDDRIYQYRFAPVRDDDGEVFAALGMSQEITERVRRERELRSRVSQQAAISELGRRALEDLNLDALLGEAVELVSETLDTEYCKVLDLDVDDDRLHLRQGVGWDDGIVGEATVSAVDEDSQAAHTLATDGPVIVEDLGTERRFSGPELLTSHDVTSGISTVIGPESDPWGILGTHDPDRREFSDHDATFLQSVANVLAAAIERHQREHQLVQQRQQLAAVNSLNQVVRDVTTAVIDQSTRAEIEATVCERLAETDSYSFAWIGEVETGSRRVTPQAQAGVEGYLDDVSITFDPDDERGNGPTGRAFRTGEVQVATDIRADDRHDPWRSTIEEYGFRASAAVPIVHEGTVYAVLNVYTERPNAFAPQERRMIAQLGEVAGHAIAAADRKQALMSDELVEVDIRCENVFEPIDGFGDIDGKMLFENTVAVGDDEHLLYGTASAATFDAMAENVETHPNWEELTAQSDGDPVRFELRVSSPPIVSAIASRGGHVHRAVIEDGTLEMSVRLPPTADVRELVKRIREVYSPAEMLRRRQISPDRHDTDTVGRSLVTALTDRQRTALEVAHHSGFFEWPRDRTGEEVAESIGVAAPTFHQHLRKGQRKVFETLFSTPTVEEA
ncbi:hypothetical protein BRC97_13115 [Halobacteriales archaeon QS_6_71_20]|nr:MAG: hypothetical protein BRC97_13115 [Halobacteriales archaeon QS_6_71_20]